MKRVAIIGLAALAVAQLAGCPYVTSETVQRATVQTSLGGFVIELDPDMAPITVSNFVQYADDGFYDGTVFHRVVADFVVQGGGLTAELEQKQARPPIVNESVGGLSNLRATVGMARVDEPDSATSQFYVNLVDNVALDATFDRPGFTVFGTVIEGMDVIDAIGAVAVEDRDELSDVPVDAVTIESVTVEEIFTGELELTPEGEYYAATREYQAAVLTRELAVDLLGYGIWWGLSGF